MHQALMATATNLHQGFVAEDFVASSILRYLNGREAVNVQSLDDNARSPKPIPKKVVAKRAKPLYTHTKPYSKALIHQHVRPLDFKSSTCVNCESYKPESRPYGLTACMRELFKNIGQTPIPPK